MFRSAFNLARHSPLAFYALLAVAPLAVSSCHGQAQGRDSQAAYTIDTPMRILVGDERARAVVDHYLPGITAGPHYYMTAAFSLRQLKPMLHGMITDANLAAMARELARIH